MLPNYYREILVINAAHYELGLPRLRVVRTQLRSRLSIKRRIMALFAELWKYHPKTGFPCNTTAYPNQCAIRMGTAFVGAGLDITKLKAVTCDYHPKSASHTLRALEFAEGLKRRVISNIGATEIYKIGAPWLEAISGRTGIVFFYHYYNREGRVNGPPNGDHIDLCNGPKSPIGTIPGILPII
jgi:hypothetical protein